MSDWERADQRRGRLPQSVKAKLQLRKAILDCGFECQGCGRPRAIKRDDFGVWWCTRCLRHEKIYQQLQEGR